MSKELLLVGSVPLESAEDVFRTFGGPLGPYLGAIPDGEVGERRWWVIRLAYQVFNGHPDLEVLRRPAPDDGVENSCHATEVTHGNSRSNRESTSCASDIRDGG